MNKLNSMANFKLAKKDAVSDTRTNIYDLYNKKLDYFESEKKNLNTYKKQLTFPSPTSETFISIDSVTEYLLISWIESQPEYLTDEDKNYFEIRFAREREKSSYDDYKFSFMPYDELRYDLIN